ncbi:MAG: glycine--tRNA ligase [Candidatus Hodarchaeaceae archaeon]|nr:glycine--tRNA ligase [Candidatus Hodarchaeaceae archaeon]
MVHKHEEVMELAKRRGFIWPSFEIYGGVGGFYDFGPLGTILKNKIIQKWREFYVIGEGFFEIDSPSVMPEEVLKASGHVDHFVDAMVECKKCGTAFRTADLAREQTGKDIEGMSKEEMEQFIGKNRVRCPDCGGELGKIFDFNAMFRTTIGPGSKRVAYLRPETAQGIFIDFKRLQRYARGKLPFGVVQIGKGYRNEISPRQGVIRLREFTMAEAEVFFDPEDPHHPKFSNCADEKIRLWRAEDEVEGREKLTEVTAEQAVKKKFVCNELMAYYLVLTKKFLCELGIPENAIRFREQTPGQRAHYSSETWDAEVDTARFGWVEVTGLAYRTDYDLSRHAEFSKEDLTIFRADKKRKVLCHVIEPSYGIDRPLYCMLEHAYTTDGKRKYLRLKKELAPIEVGVFPHLNRDGMPEKALEVHRSLKSKGFMSEYDDAGSIGRRYARADEIGIPYCVTIDHQTLKDGTATIRDRDTAAQVRVALAELPSILRSLICGEVQLGEVGEPVKK